MAEEKVANPRGATEDEAAARILSVLNRDEEPPKEEPEAEKPEEEVKEEAQPEEEARDAENTIEIDMDEPMFDVKVQGEARKISMNEALKGYMMESDYRKKTSEVARQQEEIPEKIRQAVEGERKKYIDELQRDKAVFWQVVSPRLQGVDLNKLAKDDPAAYVEAYNEIQNVNQAYAYYDHQLRQAFEQRAANELAILKREVPDWGPELKRRAEETAMSLGYTEQDLGTSIGIDAKQIKGLLELHRLREFEKQTKQQSDKAKEIVTKKIVAKPKVIKPAPKGQVQDDGAMDRLKKSGRLDDMAAVIAGRL